MLAKTRSLSFREDKKKAEEGDDDKDIPIKLIKNMVVGREQFFLPPGYSALRGWLVYNKEWDKTAELHLDLKIENNDQ